MKHDSAPAQWKDASFGGELLGLILAAPFFYLPGRLPAWGPVIGLLLLAAVLLWRRRRLGVWFARTPADWPLLLILLLLPLAVWAASPELRSRYAWPRALILLWNGAFFSFITLHSRRSDLLRMAAAGGLVAAGALIALVALFGTAWDVKAPILTALLERLPHLPTGLLGAEDGFSPNQVSGALLYILPFALAWLAVAVRQRRWRQAAPLAVAVGAMGLFMLAAQSRAGLAGLLAAFAILLLWPRRWGRWLLGATALLLPVALLLLPWADLLVQLDDATKVQGVYGSLSIAGRLEIWSRAVAALADFPLTGVGLGAFRGIAHTLYPLYLIPPDYDIAHAHNFFLQSALDFGLFGLVALLAIYLAAFVQCVRLWRTPLFAGHAAWGVGLLAALLGQAVYSLADAVSLGSKPNVLWWWLLAFIFGLAGAATTGQKQCLAEEDERPARESAA